MLFAKKYKEYVHALFNKVYRYYVLIGGRMSAKGATTYEVLVLIAIKEKCTHVVFSAIQRGIRNGTMTQFEEAIQVIEESKDITIDYTVFPSVSEIRFSNGSKVVFRGLEKKEDVKGLSGNIHTVVFDEADEFKDVDLFEHARLTLIRKDAQFVYVLNPPKNRNNQKYKYLKEDIANRNKAFSLFTTYLDNPFLSSAVVEDVEENKGTLSFRHHMLGEMVSEDGVAFNVSNVMDVNTEYSVLSRFYVVDYGMSDALAVIEAEKFVNGWVINRTLYHDGKTQGKLTEQNAYRKIVGAFGLDVRSELWIDSGGLTQVFKQNGFKNAKAMKFKDRVKQYYDAYDLLLEGSQLFIKEDNDLLLAQLENAEVKDDMIVKRKTSSDIRFDDHFVDAFMYVCRILKKLKGVK